MNFKVILKAFAYLCLAVGLQATCARADPGHPPVSSQCTDANDHARTLILNLFAHLITACETGDLATVSAIVAQDLIPINARVPHMGTANRFSGFTPLLIAAYAGQAEIINYLLQQQADVDIRCPAGAHALHWAALSGNVQAVKAILDQNVNANTLYPEAPPSGAGITALELVFTSTNIPEDACLEIAHILIQHGAVWQVGPRRQLTFGDDLKEQSLRRQLGSTCKNGNVRALASLARGLGVYDSMNGDLKAVAFVVLRFGVNMRLGESFRPLNSATPLIMACYHHQTTLTKLLLLLGANPKLYLSNGRQAIHAAACQGFLEGVRLLIDAGVDINTVIEAPHPFHDPDIAGATALIEAARQGHYELVNFLLEQGADTARVTNAGMNAWDYAMRNDYIQVAQLIQRHNQAAQLATQPPLTTIEQPAQNVTQTNCYCYGARTLQ